MLGRQLTAITGRSTTIATTTSLLQVVQYVEASQTLIAIIEELLLSKLSTREVHGWALRDAVADRRRLVTRDAAAIVGTHFSKVEMDLRYGPGRVHI